MLELLRQRLVEVLKSVAPLVGVVCLLQLGVIHAPAVQFLQFLGGALLVALGMLLLLAGIDLGILPMGRFIGAELPRRGSALFIAGTAFLLGFTTTAAEPDVLILSAQVQAASRGTLPAQPLTWLIAAGVGACAALALLRIVLGFSLRALLCGVLLLVLALSFAVPAALVPLAYDAGSVTTGVLSAPVLLALALGLASVLAGRTAASDGFGLLGLASLGPIVAVLLLGLVLR